MMREILFLAHRIPWPADRGDKIRSHHILKRLCEMAPVHVGTFADDERDMGFAEAMDGLVASRHVELRDKPHWQAGLEGLFTGRPISVQSFASRTMQNWVDARIASGRISHIFCFSGQMAQYVPNDFAGRFIMDFVDVDSAKFESYAEEGHAFMRWVNRREGRVLGRFETEIAARANASLLVSEAEAALFQRRTATSIVMALGNGIDTAFYDPDGHFKKLHPPFPDPLIVFTGQMDYRPNIEAVSDFAQNAMPVISAQHPEATFAIVGRNPNQAVSDLSMLPGVQVTGAVEDVRSWLAAADVVVAPLRIARGIQNKVLEAMAMAKPVVASPAAAEGIDAEHGQHFFVEENVGAEAARVCTLLAEPSSGLSIGKAARAHVMAHYGWRSQLAPLDRLMGLGTDDPQ
ncbi:TIGR03087 family PEP-CTERM/XrtA system glycosyltransferase [Sphingorhabdus sp. IMCC26285]|uniref:TIGR03087 family PEP-CTERM/XrtA system glycosyltransferase n=1 Tax=Sphingorhabdus profundilacus TaxID=2509718 RepID=A0A6I4M011_9SPHN|nr:TIGR03087 family PEP-CTERM/XrtA system glycosyltransferase [Sphingorhabdus profundilacus]